MVPAGIECQQSFRSHKRDNPQPRTFSFFTAAIVQKSRTKCTVNLLENFQRRHGVCVGNQDAIAMQILIANDRLFLSSLTMLAKHVLDRIRLLAHPLRTTRMWRCR
jgi:hypothetical protein